MPEEKELFNITGVEVFAVGEWNGEEYSRKDLEDMVAAFVGLAGKIKPYLKLGHGEGQELLRADELPAAGWITNLYCKGDKLYADFSRIPGKIYELIKLGAYRRVSCEIWWNMDVEGKKYRRVLKAVALLGAEAPAVTNLDDIMALYVGAEPAFAFSSDAEIKKYDYEKEDDMEKVKELEGKLAEFSAKIEELTKNLAAESEAKASREKEIEELKKLSGDTAEKYAAALRDKKMAEIKLYVDGLVASKKIMPAQCDALTALLMLAFDFGGEKKYKMGEVDHSAESLIKLFADSCAIPLNTEGNSEVGEKKPNAEDTAVVNARAYAKEKNISFRDALIALSKEAAPKEDEGED